MGRMLGSFADREELDRPDLNKCPDCGCFFPQDNCPICGKPCPEEMRAGNRKPPKKKKKRGNENGERLIYLDWYYRWWFIILMLIIFPLVGIILLIVSPHKKKSKIIFAVIAALYFLISNFGPNIYFYLLRTAEQPVNASLDFAEYSAVCTAVSPEEYYRGTEGYRDDYLRISLTVERRIENKWGTSNYGVYYLCRTEGESFSVLVRDCVRENKKNYLPGDNITVYGEGAGTPTVYDETDTAYSAPCINAAYIVLE